MSADVTTSAAHDDAPLEYRSVHTFAVLGLLLGVLSAVTVSFTPVEYATLVAPIPLVGLIVSLVALRSIASAPDLYTGRRLAQIGATVSIFFLIAGVGYSSYIYATEVPDGYIRTSFIAMKPSESDMVDRKPIPEDVEQLIREGERVFIKGYIRPGSSKFNQNMKEFLLVRDNQQCCFGDLSKVQYFDQIQVDLTNGLTTDYHNGLFRLGGVLKVGPGDAKNGTPLSYHLEADYVKP